MQRRLTVGWGALLALILVGLVPTGYPTRAAADRALGQGARDGAPLGGTPAGLRRFDLPTESLRPTHAGGAALASTAPRLSFQLVVLPAGNVTSAESHRAQPVAFPYFPTGPPLSS